ncbi:hypothetical protein AB0C87_24815 [Actinomadura sp. NPDC048021]|uniref:hypothetical protein n=1 Tax=Actinomadura sp. NPDC048021 TaxID=3155385 RepID=UPI0033ECE29D
MFTDYDEPIHVRTRTSSSEVEVLIVDGDNQVTATPVEFAPFDELEIPDVP